jgi:hypothetical protein
MPKVSPDQSCISLYQHHLNHYLGVFTHEPNAVTKKQTGPSPSQSIPLCLCHTDSIPVFYLEQPRKPAKYLSFTTLSIPMRVIHVSQLNSYTCYQCCHQSMNCSSWSRLFTPPLPSIGWLRACDWLALDSLWNDPTSPPPAEMVAQLLKRAGKRTWRPEGVDRATGGGGSACGAVAGDASVAGLMFVVSVPRRVSFSM